MFNFKNTLLVASLCPFLVSTSWAKNGVESIYVNGKIYTAKDNASLQQAIAVSDDGTILKVGNNAEIRKLADADTQIVDLQQKVLMPGLIDTHIHALISGVESVMATMDEGEISVPAVVEKLKVTQKDGTAVYGDVLVLNGLSSEYWELEDQLSAVFNHNEWKNQPVAFLFNCFYTVTILLY